MLGLFGVLEGLYVDDYDKFLAKIDRFSYLGAAGMHAVVDFDRTLTVRRPGFDDEVTTWHILNEHLPEGAQEQYRQYFKKYRTLELSGDLTAEHAIEWWTAILDLFIENSISLAEVERSFLDKASIRHGTQDFFAELGENDIPSTILSAGIRNVIDLWAEKYNISPTLTISTELELDSADMVVGWDRSTLVHVLNKHEADHPQLTKTRSDRPNTLVVGDSINDSTMAVGDTNVLRVRLLDRRDDDPGFGTEIERTFSNFDAVITNGSMQPLTDLVRGIIDPAR